MLGTECLFFECEQNPNFHFVLGIFTLVKQCGVQIAACLQGVGMLGPKHALTFLQYLAEEALGIAILTAVEIDAGDRELHSSPFQWIAGTVSELLSSLEMG